MNPVIKRENATWYPLYCVDANGCKWQGLSKSALKKVRKTWGKGNFPIKLRSDINDYLCTD